MSYQERIENTYHTAYAEARPWITFYKTAKLRSSADVQRADDQAARDIAEMEKLIDDLKEYRQALAARYAQLETMPYRDRIELERSPGYNSGVKYYLRIMRRYEDGTEDQLEFHCYDGKQRREALKAFEDLKRERPGIEAVKDIEKKSWER